MSEFSTEDMQSAADDVRRGGFGDFMFRDPDQKTKIISSHVTTRRNASKRLTSSNSRTTSHSNISHPKRCNCQTGWRNSPDGNTQIKTCWKDGNMWEFYVRRRK